MGDHHRDPAQDIADLQVTGAFRHAEAVAKGEVDAPRVDPSLRTQHAAEKRNSPGYDPETGLVTIKPKGK